VIRLVFFFFFFFSLSLSPSSFEAGFPPRFALLCSLFDSLLIVTKKNHQD
jgi:hypothetical protein